MLLIFPTHCSYTASFGNQEAETLNFISVHLLLNTRQLFEMHVSIVHEHSSCRSGVLWASPVSRSSSTWNEMVPRELLRSELQYEAFRWCLNDPPQPQEPVVSGGCDRTTAGLDEGLLRPLPHLSPFTLQPVEEEEITIRKSYSSVPIQKHAPCTSQHFQGTISIADILKKKERDIKLHWS